jgi:hypothetical protein
LFLIRPLRGHLWKGKQNKNSEETLKEMAMFYDNEIAREFCCYKI